MTSTGPEGGASTGVEAGAENELRLRRRLWNDRAALKAVRELGLADGTMRRFRLGMREPYLAGGSGTVTTRALTFPVPNADGTRTSKWSYLNVEGLTMHAPHPQGWGAGAPRTCYSGPVTAGSSLLVVPTPLDMWLLWQRVADSLPGLIVACPSHPAGVPVEWRRADYWRGWRRVVLGLGGGADHDEVVQMVLRTADREIARCQPPGGESWADLVRTGGSAPEIGLLFEGAQPCVPRAVPAAAGPGLVTGDFEAAPLAIEGAVRDGRMFYPVTVERREVERGGRECGSVVQRYVTRVLRSDGVLLDVERLPAPRGTPSSGRVLALSDGTRILSAPKPGPFGTWRYGSIKAFIEARERGVRPVHRSVDRLAADVEAHLRSSVWLPHEADYALSTAFVLATFVHRVFDALPILLVNGAKGSGKSELGQAFASLCFNGLVAGRVTAAGLIRLMAESRGTVVLDDMESIGSASAAARDLIQILKTSYKAATARRLGSGRDGATETVDYFGPKVITNITGADAVLSSRMLAIRTRQMAEGDSLMDAVVDVAALRDELHCWAMCEAEAVERRLPPSGCRCAQPQGRAGSAAARGCDGGGPGRAFRSPGNGAGT